MTLRNTLTSVGLLLLRITIGGLMLVHGIPKLTGYADMVDKFPDPIGLGSRLSLISAIGAEVGCSALLILGLATRIAAIPLAFTMIVALFLVHSNDPWNVKELAAVYLCIFLSIVFTGPGEFSLDRTIFSRRKGKSAA